MFRYIEERSNKIEIGTGQEFIKNNYLFLDKNLRVIDLEKKIKKEYKKGNIVKIKEFEGTGIPKSFQIKKNKRLVEFYAVNKEIIKRLDYVFEYLKDNGLDYELVNKIEEKKIVLALSIFQSEKFKKNEEEQETMLDNCIMIESFISACLRNIYEEKQNG